MLSGWDRIRSDFFKPYLKVKIISYLLVCFFILAGCASTRTSQLNVGNSKSLNISLKSEHDKISLKGLSVLTKDSSYFNVYGKLGVFEMNVTRIFVFGDSIVIVDLINKKIFRSRYGKMSQIIYNFFTGNYSIKEEQFVYAICSLFLKDISKKNKPEIDYKFTNKVKKSFIDLQLNSNQNSYFIKMKVLSNNKNDNIPFNYINKYSNFENISIEFR
jgi:hypothetical protein